MFKFSGFGVQGLMGLGFTASSGRLRLEDSMFRDCVEFQVLGGSWGLSKSVNN